jgi:hypothetical protein
LNDFGTALDVPASNQCFFPDTATGDTFRIPECSIAGGDAAGARNAFTIIKNQMCAPGGLVNFQCRCRTGGYYATRNLVGKQVRLDIRHAASGGVRK